MLRAFLIIPGVTFNPGILIPQKIGLLSGQTLSVQWFMNGVADKGRQGLPGQLNS